VEKTTRGPRVLIEAPSPLSDALSSEIADASKIWGPKWLGKGWSGMEEDREEIFRLDRWRAAGVISEGP